MKRMTFYTKWRQGGKNVALRVKGWSDGEYYYYKSGSRWWAVNPETGLAVNVETAYTRRDAVEIAHRAQVKEAIAKYLKSEYGKKAILEFHDLKTGAL